MSNRVQVQASSGSSRLGSQACTIVDTELLYPTQVSGAIPVICACQVVNLRAGGDDLFWLHFTYKCASRMASVGVQRSLLLAAVLQVPRGWDVQWAWLQAAYWVSHRCSSLGRNSITMAAAAALAAVQAVGRAQQQQQQLQGDWTCLQQQSVAGGGWVVLGELVSERHRHMHSHRCYGVGVESTVDYIIITYQP